MLSIEVVREICRLLDEDQLSQRAIARTLRVSRGVVGAIANGRRGTHGRELRLQDDGEEPLGPPERCPGCGGMVYLPCKLCRTRAFRLRLALEARRGREDSPRRVA